MAFLPISSAVSALALTVALGVTLGGCGETSASPDGQASPASSEAAPVGAAPAATTATSGTTSGGAPPAAEGAVPEAVTPAATEATAEAGASAGALEATDTPTPPIPEAQREAYQRLTAQVAASPGDVRAACSLGAILRRARRHDDAIALMGNALESPWTDEDIRPGTRQACEYELGRSFEAIGDPSAALDHYRSSLSTPHARRRDIVRARLLDVLRGQAARDCSALRGPVGMRALLAHGEDPAVRACLEQTQAPCQRIPRDDSRFPEFAGDNYFGFRRLNDDLAFGLLDGELFTITGQGARAVVRSCALDLPEGAGLGRPWQVRARAAELAAVHVTATLSYTGECDAEEVGEEGEGTVDCRMEDSFGAWLVFSHRGVFRLALGDDINDSESMVGAQWDAPEHRTGQLFPTSAAPSERRLAPFGRELFVRDGVLVPGARIP